MLADLTIPLIVSGFGLGMIIGYFFYKFFIGGWTNKEVDGLLYWALRHKEFGELKELSLVEILELYQQDSKIERRKDQIKKRNERRDKTNFISRWTGKW